VNPVADRGADSVSSHLSCGVGNDPNFIVQQHAESAVRQDFVDYALDFEKFFFRHSSFTFRRGIDGGSAGILAVLAARVIGPLNFDRGRVCP